jgi:hypothetical protein
MSGMIFPEGSQGHDLRQPLQVAPFRRPDHPAMHALVSALLPQLETMHMIGKGQVPACGVQEQIKFVNSLFGLAV